MRYVMFAVLAAMAMPLQAQPVDQGLTDQLCLAAGQDSALGVLVDQLIEEGRMPLKSGEELLSLPCGGNQSLLSRVVDQHQAENLEYAVIDMGLSLKRSHVLLQGQDLPLGQAMQRLAEQGDGETRAFVSDYLDSLADEDFNPNLRLSLK
ncbi:hypothetical protein A11A3_04965 [Alcanivorax hongdengensis A-11-3]|uniref:Uncharacterized protein n=1 Tax=Alcanivorax hongdengensis A-11-3 TaxID=1177179 RepID=L0WEP0_9GAMM|nr:hypothetical protein [Alcanivorax hongdengensis]EKF75303.1 hypothetical protein A11A3_04965 [Alcanivorax hongdengensis A-11-3]